MDSLQEIALDIDELTNLLRITTRPRIKDMLVSEIQKLQLLKKTSSNADIMDSETSEPVKQEPTQPVVTTGSLPAGHCISVAKTVPRRHYKEITTYAWDQSDKFMKIYVTVSGVHKIDKANISVDYTQNSFQLKVDNLDGANYTCRVVGLWGKISTADSFHKVKTDTVLLMLKKSEEKKTWAYVTEREDKKKPTPKMDEKKDPNEGMMDLMKKMYDEGDDEMKRTIAKAWTESRNKTSTNDL